MRNSSLIIGILFCLISQQSLAASTAEIFVPDPSLPDIADVSLKIISMQCGSWSNCTVQAEGTFNGTPVAVEVSVKCQGHQGRITYRSIGKKSNDLLAALASIYKLPRPKKPFAAKAEADFILIDASQKKMSGKVFFKANGPESEYAELFTNIDKSNQVLEIAEKDPDYRRNVIQGLSQ